MGYIKIRFSNDLDEIESKLDKTIADMFHSLGPKFSFSKTTWKPQLDIYETKEKVFVVAELAGVEKDNLELEINPRAVRIFGKRVAFPPAQNGRYRLAEIQYGPFERVLYMRTPINTETVSARYVDGFLHVEMEKAPYPAKQKVPIKSE
jgi:HSP20 family protein